MTVLPGQPWAEPALEIDEDTEREGSVVADEGIRVLARASRLALRCDPAARHRGEIPGTDVVDFPLHCVAQAHPDCRFRWIRVTLDVSGTAGASIADLSPRDEISEHPVKITTTYSSGLKFNIAAIPLQPDLSAERTTEQDTYFPAVSVSGIGFGYAMWDFTAIGEAPLKVDRALRLLAAIPASASEIPAHLTVRASVTARGLPVKIPLIGRQTRTIPLTAPAVTALPRQDHSPGLPSSLFPEAVTLPARQIPANSTTRSVPSGCSRSAGSALPFHHRPRCLL
jgi:hypothetical protein